MSQFWQKKQPMLQPAVPIENIRVPGQEMIQRLFLDGINLHRRRMRVPEAVKFAALVRANEAEPGLPLANMAVPRTEVAMHFAVRLRLPPARFVERVGFLQYFQFLHGTHSSNPIIRLNPRTRFLRDDNDAPFAAPAPRYIVTTWYLGSP